MKAVNLLVFLLLLVLFGGHLNAAEPEKSEVSSEEQKAFAEYKEKLTKACDRIEAVLVNSGATGSAILQLAADLEETEKKYVQAQKDGDKKAMTELSDSYVAGLNRLFVLRRDYLQATKTAYDEIRSCDLTLTQEKGRFEKQVEADNIRFWDRLYSVVADLRMPEFKSDFYRDLVNKICERIAADKKIDQKKLTNKERAEIINQAIPLVLKERANDILRWEKEAEVLLKGFRSDR
ncbi:MAG: hypothetical protein K2W82_18315 [Candidatus Obscuribacterales bacterium]|jgi:hypothetical protein|nr:hypothetical protein [Candidatus Obscuribacterales bacterium]